VSIDKIVLQDLKEGRNYSFSRDEVKIGRSSDNHLVLKDSTVSRRHARLFFKDGTWFVEDLGSKNGTFLNGGLLKEPARVFPGDEISLGNRTLKVLEISSPLKVEETVVDEHIREDLPGVDTEKWKRIMKSIEELSKEIIASPSAERLLYRVAEVAREALGAERAVVVVREGGKDRIAASSFEEGSERDISLSRSILKRAIEERVGVLTSDALSDSRFGGEESVVMMGIRSAACVPIWKGGKVLGAIYVDSSMARKIQTVDDLEILTVLGNYVGIVLEQRKLFSELQRQMRIRERLERYHSPAVIRRMLAEGSDTTLVPGRFFHAVGTVLFADIVGFSSMMETASAEEVGAFLNDFLSAMTDIIFQYEGTLDKYMGDGVMAVFGVPFPMEAHARRALMAGYEMKRKSGDFKWKGEEVKIRIGINSGPMIAGDFGSEKRLEFTVLGHSVNLASRLQSEVAAPGEIAVGRATVESAGEGFVFERKGRFKVKGIKEEVEAFLLKEVKR